MPQRIIDLRSDTTTKPTEKMRKVMYDAEVGDDGFGDDPNINALQDKCAGLLGKEAAIWLPSGTMSNQIALRSLCSPGDEVIVESDTHLWHYEMGASAALAGLTLVRVPGENGVMKPAELEEAIRPDLPWFPKTALICIENTHNRAGGVPLSAKDMDAITSTAENAGIPVFIDGARLFNASVATGIEPAEYAKNCKAVTICMSKGLGVPGGSVLCGPADMIRRAHQIRQMMGGVMRQVGIFAAAAIYALDNHVERLADDHRRARRLASLLSDIPKIKVNPTNVHTNIVVIDVNELALPNTVVEGLAGAGVLAVPFGSKGVRCVTHLDISDEDIDATVKAFKTVVS